MLQQDEIIEAMNANREGRDADFVDLPSKRKQMGSGLTE